MAKPAAEKPPKPDVESDSDSSDDEDYVPDDKGGIHSEGEDEADDSDVEQHSYDAETGEEYTTTRSGKRRINDSPFDEGDSSKKHRVDSELVHQSETLNKKNRLDALWKELNTPISKPTSRPELLAAESASATGSSGSGWSGTSKSESVKMVTITTSYDFAGETVTVTKDVPENSKEARDAAQKNKTSGGNNNNKLSTSASAASPSTSVASSASTPSSGVLHDSIVSTAISPTAESSDTTTTPISTSTSTISTSSSIATGGPRVTTRPSILDSLAKKGPIRYVRKKSTLDELAATYGVKKPPKLNTLEKSKLDWNDFVGKEGIEDELKHHNKDGYMEKVAFLQRTDEHRDREYQMLKKK